MNQTGPELARQHALKAAEILGATPVDERLLSPREVECLELAAAGKSEWEIARILGISEHTVEKHLLNAKTKLGAVNRVQAVAVALRLGVIT